MCLIGVVPLEIVLGSKWTLDRAEKPGAGRVSSLQETNKNRRSDSLKQVAAVVES